MYASPRLDVEGIGSNDDGTAGRVTKSHRLFGQMRKKMYGHRGKDDKHEPIHATRLLKILFFLH